MHYTTEGSIGVDTQGTVQHTQGDLQVAGAGIHVTDRQRIQRQRYIFQAILGARQAVDRGVVLLHIARVCAGSAALAQSHLNLAQRAAVSVDAYTQIAQRLRIADGVGRGVETINTGWQNAELIAAVGVGGGAEGQVVVAGIQVAVQPGPGQGDGLPGKALAVRGGAAIG